MECQCCRAESAIWAWQPFGPSEGTLGSFTLLGSHYRGFPVVKIGQACKATLEHGEDLGFTYKGILYAGNANIGFKCDVATVTEWTNPSEREECASAKVHECTKCEERIQTR